MEVYDRTRGQMTLVNHIYLYLPVQSHSARCSGVKWGSHRCHTPLTT